MSTLEEATEIIDSYTKFECIPGKPITDGYENENTKYETTDD